VTETGTGGLHRERPQRRTSLPAAITLLSSTSIGCRSGGPITAGQSGTRSGSAPMVLAASSLTVLARWCSRSRTSSAV
jgi:hypothetical protein